METKLYNVRLNYSGEGTFTFVVRNVGEVTIQAGRDIYLKNADVETIDGLRQLKPLRLNININGKPEGCFKTYNVLKVMSNLERSARMSYDFRDAIKNNVITTDELDAIKKSAQNGPIPTDEITTNTTVTENTNSESTTSENTTKEISYDSYVLKSTNHKGKQLKKLSKRQLGGIKKYASEEDLVAIENYLSTLK